MSGQLAMPRKHTAESPARRSLSPLPKKDQDHSFCISEDQQIKMMLTCVFSSLSRDVPPLGSDGCAFVREVHRVRIF